MRKNAKLHPCDKINVYYKGNPKYKINENIIDIVKKITRIVIQKYNKDKTIFYEEKCEKNDLTLLFEIC